MCVLSSLCFTGIRNFVFTNIHWYSKFVCPFIHWYSLFCVRNWGSVPMLRTSPRRDRSEAGDFRGTAFVIIINTFIIIINIIIIIIISSSSSSSSIVAVVVVVVVVVVVAVVVVVVVVLLLSSSSCVCAIVWCCSVENRPVHLLRVWVSEGLTQANS